jgi:hypothetical protein
MAELEEHNREVAKLYFEFFKHFTTIVTAVVLIEITFYQQFSLSWLAILGVLVSG